MIACEGIDWTAVIIVAVWCLMMLGLLYLLVKNT